RLRCRRVGRPAHDDDVAALLATDLEYLPADLVVRNRVLGSAGITDDLHQRLASRDKNAPEMTRICRRTGHSKGWTIILTRSTHASQAPVTSTIVLRVRSSHTRGAAQPA